MTALGWQEYAQAFGLLIVIVAFIYMLPAILKRTKFGAMAAASQGDKKIQDAFNIDMKHRITTVTYNGAQYTLLLSEHQPVLLDRKENSDV